MLEIIPISAFKDNYIWLGVNPETRLAFVVDPGDAAPFLDYVKKHDLILRAILLTHKHPDHTGGVSAIVEAFPEVVVYAHPEDKVAGMTNWVGNEDIIKLEAMHLGFRVMHIPGHTLGHVAYYSHDMLFCGDTLFGAGCGRVFEGTPAQMLDSLNRLASLPDDTLVYCGHEYTLANLRFAAVVEPLNEDIQQRILLTKKLRSENKPSLPSTMLLERKTNPFLRCTEKTVIASVENHVGHPLANTVEVFHALREWKNNW